MARACLMKGRNRDSSSIIREFMLKERGDEEDQNKR